MKIILASTSPNRQEAMRLAQIPFEILATDVDEKSIVETDFVKRALAIAQLKMDKALSLVKKEAVIIAADGFNVYEGKILEKPRDKNEAKQMLQFSRGKMGTFYTACILVNTKTQEKLAKVFASKYWFRQYSDTEIDKYIKSIDVTKYAAAFTPINSAAISFIKKIEGPLSPFTHSLPLDFIVPKLYEWVAL